MPNAKTQSQGPNATYIPLAGVGVLRREKRKFNFLHFFRYQHVGIPNENSGVGGKKSQDEMGTDKTLIMKPIAHGAIKNTIQAKTRDIALLFVAREYFS